MQRPYTVDEIESLRRMDRVRIALIRSCKAGELTHLLETDPPPKERWRYFINAPDFAAWLAAQGQTPSTDVAAWFEAVAPGSPSVVPPMDAPVARQAERYQRCIDEGLVFDSNPLRPLPRGIKRVAKALGITRQSLSADLSKHIERLHRKSR